jgi:hypothetical protein
MEYAMKIINSVGKEFSFHGYFMAIGFWAA